MKKYLIALIMIQIISLMFTFMVYAKISINTNTTYKEGTKILLDTLEEKNQVNSMRAL